MSHRLITAAAGRGSVQGDAVEGFLPDVLALLQLGHRAQRNRREAAAAGVVPAGHPVPRLVFHQIVHWEEERGERTKKRKRISPVGKKS